MDFQSDLVWQFLVLYLLELLNKHRCWLRRWYGLQISQTYLPYKLYSGILIASHWQLVFLQLKEN